VELSQHERTLLFMYRLMSDKSRTVLDAVLWRLWLHQPANEAPTRRAEEAAMISLRLDSVPHSKLTEFKNTAVLAQAAKEVC